MRIRYWSSGVCSSDLLTALGRDEIAGELREFADSISELLEILRNRVRLYEVMRQEFEAVEAVAVTPRRTQILAALDDIADEELNERQDMAVSVMLGGYKKRTEHYTFRAEKRGGKCTSGKGYMEIGGESGGGGGSLCG